MAEPVIRVVMVDDHEMVLHGVNAMLTHFTDDVVVVGTATTSADAFVEVTNERPDVLVCDIRLGKDSGLDLCQQVKAFDPDGRNRPPLEAAASARPFLRAARVGADLGLPPLLSAAVGGASDGNFTAAIGVPTLDGLGAVGGGAHADSEYVAVAELSPRAALVAALVADLLRAGSPSQLTNRGHTRGGRRP